MQYCKSLVPIEPSVISTLLSKSEIETRNITQHLQELEVSGQLREMAVCLYHLHRRLALDLLRHEPGNGIRDDEIVGGLDEGARDGHLVQHVPLVAQENEFGDRESSFWPHSLEAILELGDGGRVVWVHAKWGKTGGPAVEVGFNARQELFNL